MKAKAFLLIPIAVIGVMSANAAALDTWTRVDGFTNAVSGVQYVNGLFFVNNDQALFASTNGTTWSKTPVLSGIRLRVAYGNGTFVAAGQRTVATSPDGFNWTARTLGLSATINALAFGNGKFVAVGPSTLVWLSEDGIEWSPIDTLVLGGSGRDIVFGGGLFKAVGGSGFVGRSIDGLKWEKEQSPVTVTLVSITYGSGRWLAVGSSGFAISTIGDSWQRTSKFTDANLTGAAFAGDTFVVIGEQTLIWTSKDGVNFLGRNTAGDVNLLGITFGDGAFLAGGPEGLLSSAPIEIKAEPQGPALKAGHFFGFTAEGQTGIKYRVESSDAAQTKWVPAGDILLHEATQLWIDPRPADQSERYYRLITVPQQ